MNPAEFADVVVIPTVREHLAARGDRRLAYLACIATYSLVEYVTRAEAGAGASEAALNKARCNVGKAIRAVCAPAYEVVQGICNGTKHAGSDRGQFPFTPGSERHIPKAVWGKTFWGHARWGVPGLSVEHEGRRMFIDRCVQALLHTFVMCYPQHFDAVDLSFQDEQFRPAAS